jgi:hypothetical protein
MAQFRHVLEDADAFRKIAATSDRAPRTGKSHIVALLRRLQAVRRTIAN